MQAISAVDRALRDLDGNAAGVPLDRISAGARRRTIPFCVIRHENPEMAAGRADAVKAEGFHRIEVRETGEAEMHAARNAARPETRLMSGLGILGQRTAGSIDADSKTATVLAAKQAETRGELLEAAYPGTQVPTC
jgi:hypothetical protein